MESEKIYKYYQWACFMELYFKDNSMEVPRWFKEDKVRDNLYKEWSEKFIIGRLDPAIDIFKLPIESVALWQNRVA